MVSNRALYCWLEDSANRCGSRKTFYFLEDSSLDLLLDLLFLGHVLVSPHVVPRISSYVVPVALAEAANVPYSNSWNVNAVLFISLYGNKAARGH